MMGEFTLGVITGLLGALLMLEPVLAASRPSTRKDLKRARAHRQFLWSLLDDIDTVDDAARTDDKLFRDTVRKIQNKRFEISTSDGYTVTFPDDTGD